MGGLGEHLAKQILEEFTRGHKQKIYYYLPTQNFVAYGVSDANYQLYMPSPYTYILGYLEHAVQTYFHEDTNLEINQFLQLICRNHDGQHIEPKLGQI